MLKELIINKIKVTLTSDIRQVFNLFPIFHSFLTAI